MYKQMIFVASLFVVVAVAACGSNPQQDRAQSSMSYQYNSEQASSTVVQPAAQAPRQPVALPPECQNGANIRFIKQDQKVSICGCSDNQFSSYWGAVMNSSLPNTPDQQCQAGLFYGWQIRRETADGHIITQYSVVTSSRVETTQALPTPAATPVLIPEPVASAPRVDPPSPSPQASASAPPPVQVVTTTEQESRIKITYECKAGEVAKRILNTKTSKDKTESREIQTCGGKTLLCLKDQSAKQDFNIPPCTCNGDKTPRQSFGSVWMCD